MQELHDLQQFQLTVLDIIQAYNCDHQIYILFEGPVSRLEKDHNWTRPRPEKTGPAVWSFHF